MPHVSGWNGAFASIRPAFDDPDKVIL